MNTPNGFSYSINGDQCRIEHRRTGMGCLNLFLGLWFVGWTGFCGFVIHGFLTGGKLDNGMPIPLWFVLVFVIPWFVAGFFLLYSNFAKKTFQLAPNGLSIETKLLAFRWRVFIPRESITSIKQVKDGGEGDDSFPSWGLRIMSTAELYPPIFRVVSLDYFFPIIRFRSILARLPYEHSEWLAVMIGHWAGINPHLCDKE